MTATGLRAAPAVTLGVLVLWAAADAVSAGASGWSPALYTLLATGAFLSALRLLGRWEPLTRMGVFPVGAAYLGGRLAGSGLDVVPALAFVTLAIVHVEVRSLAERFAPMYDRHLSPDARRRIDAALARASLRLGIAAALAVLVPIFAADLAISGVVPATSIPTAIFLAAALIGIVSLLALLPVLRPAEEGAE